MLIKPSIININIVCRSFIIIRVEYGIKKGNININYKNIIKYIISINCLGKLKKMSSNQKNVPHVAPNICAEPKLVIK